MYSKDNIKVVIITGDSNRHKYFANIVSKYFSVQGIVSESKIAQSSFINSINEAEVKFLEKHFEERSKCENKLLGTDLTFPKIPNSIKVDNKQSNSIEVFEFVKSCNPDIILLYGSSIIKDPLLTFFENKVVNLHLGLSPYYRGSGTNFWPIFDGLPECVGSTIHIATLKVDAGNIISQVRPKDIRVEDSIHEIGTKALMSGIEEMCLIIPFYLNGTINLTKQNLEIGKVFRRKDFKYSSLVKAKANLKNGLIKKYLESKISRDLIFPIKEFNL